MEILEEMLKMQKKFQDKYGYYPPLHRVASAIASEAMELWQAGKGKWWSKKDYNRHDKVEEVVDILHFFLIACLELGISAQELFDEYSKKLAENYRRQKRGY